MNFIEPRFGIDVPAGTWNLLPAELLASWLEIVIAPEPKLMISLMSPSAPACIPVSVAAEPVVVVARINDVAAKPDGFQLLLLAPLLSDVGVMAPPWLSSPENDSDVVIS